MLTTWAGARFSPLSLFAANEQGAWYDPSDLSTLFQDSAGTVPVTAVGQPVGKILDKSGRGNHATQAATVSRPLLQQDSSGRYYLAFDGVDDFLVTAAINFTATDKMSVMAGLRKLSDAGRGIVVELSSSYANSGAFGMTAPDSAASDLGWHINGAGTTWSDQAIAGSAAPFSSVMTGTANLSAAAGSQAGLRSNGTNAAAHLMAVGGGNFGNYPLYIGRRGGATLPFSGRIYSLIVRGALSSQAQIEQAERHLNQRTGAY